VFLTLAPMGNSKIAQIGFAEIIDVDRPGVATQAPEQGQSPTKRMTHKKAAPGLRKTRVTHGNTLDCLMSMGAASQGFPRLTNGISLFVHKESLCMKLSRQIPLNTLRVFESVARLMSFTKAGQELGMTQTAVSYQIKLLEETLDQPLFLRRPRQIEFTEAGSRLAPRVAEAFGLIETALSDVRATRDETLTINTTPTFAAHWLARRIGNFQLKMPHIAVRLITSTSMANPDSDAGDVFIRYGQGVWSGMEAHHLMDVDFTPMLSPRLLEYVGPLKTPRDLLKCKIIDPGDPWWRHWFDAAGVSETDLDRRPRNLFGSQTLEASSAIAGHGVAILTPAFYREDLSSGRLVMPFSLVCNDEAGYWFAFAESRRNQAKIKAFRDWILRDIADDDDLKPLVAKRAQ
jgi:LysR family transcriptional regulator, glycine cleavage system transcriptional activator